MDRHELNKMFDGLTPDPARERELLHQLLQDGARRKKPMKNWKQAVLAVAAAALLVTGAAAAVVQYLGVQIVDGAGGEEDADVWLKGGITYYPVDSLSEEAAVLDDPFYAAKTFDSWGRMEEFLGVELMDNPVLDAAPATHFSYSWNDGDKRTMGRFMAIGSGGLSQISAVGCYEIGEANIIVEGYLFTDRHKEQVENWDEQFIGYRFRDDFEINRESYTAQSGLEAQIMEIEGKAVKGNDSCKAAFSLNGVPFVVTVMDGKDLEENYEVLIQVLDGFR